MHVDRVARREQFGDAPSEEPLREAGCLAAYLIHDPVESAQPDACEMLNNAEWKDFSHHIDNRVNSGDRVDIAGGTLQHIHLGPGARQRRHQGDRGRAAADDSDLLAGAIQVIWPMLGMDQSPGELLHPREFRGVAVVVVVVAGAQVQELGAVSRRAGRGVDAHRPDVGIGPEIGAGDLGREGDMPVDVVVAGRVLQIVANVRAIGDGVAFMPGVVPETERIDIAVGADSGVAEQVPGPADALAALDDVKAAAGAAQSDSGIDTGYPGADDENVY
ncbi:Uncharacterised protein [Mycobacteroides abscessus subsp. abscessus]|nr:Uncharacterised protein [Mycobacteroides abscessus subsp. abscessus]